MLVFSVLVVLVAIAALLLGLFALFRNPRDSQNISFFIFASLVFVWTLFNFFGSNIINHTWTKWLVLSDFATGILLAWSFWFFTRVMYARALTKKVSKLWIISFSLLNLGLVVASYANYVVSIGIENNDLVLTNQALYTPYSLLTFIYLLAGIVSLIIARVRSKGQQKAQFSLILFGLAAAVILVATPNLILPLFISNSWFKTFAENMAYFGFFLLVVSIAYAIAKHRLFDIKLVVARSIAYTMLLATLGLVYGFSLFGISNLLFEGRSLAGPQQVIYIVLALFLAFSFQPLRRFFEHLTDNIFYRDRYETQAVLNTINSILTSQIDLHLIMSATLKHICESLKLRHGDFIVLDEHSVYQTTSYGKSDSSNLKYPEFEILHQNLILADEIEDSRLRQFLMAHNISASLRLKTQEGVVGYILFGPKQNGSIYNNQDIRLLEILGDELAIAVQNARSYEKISQFNITLQKRIQEATHKLTVQNQRLKELDEAKDEFISMASHQLRTPLTSIKGYISMLMEGDAGKLNEKQYEFADMAAVSAGRMIFLISDMLNVSRISTGKLVIEKAPLDLDAVVRDEIKQLRRTADARQVKLAYQPPTAKLPLLNLDEGKTRQVIMNFMDNAVYYAPKSTVEVSLGQVEDRIRFTVKDHGIGVPAAAQKQLFTKFFRAGNAKKARPDGTGLGLFMAKMVIEMQGGEIVFSSQEGKGSTFGFEFPLPAAKPEPAPAKAAAKPAAVAATRR